MDFTVSTFFEGDDVSSVNGFLRFLDLDEGRRSSEGGENAQGEDGEGLGEHVAIQGMEVGRY